MLTIAKNNAIRHAFVSGSIVHANLSAGKTCWFTCCIAQGADRQDVRHTVFGDLTSHD
jgi:hypothetical protein